MTQLNWQKADDIVTCFGSYCLIRRYTVSEGKVPCLRSVTGFSSKLVFNLAEHPTLL